MMSLLIDKFLVYISPARKAGVFVFALCFSISSLAQNNSKQFIQEKIQIKKFELEKFVLPIQDIKTVKHGAYSYQMKSDRRFEVELNSGKMIESENIVGDAKDQQAKSIAEFCLPKKVMKSLKDAFENAEVCIWGQALGSNQVCAQVLKKSEFQLVSKSRTLAVGGANDSCGNGLTDLCASSDRIKITRVVDLLKTEYKKNKFARYKCN